MESYSLKTNNSLERFNKLIPGKKNVPQDIDSKFTPSGDFVLLEGIDVIIKGLCNMLLTSAESYVFDPVYGVGIHKYIFEPADEITKNAIENDVNDAVRRYESRASVTTNIAFLSNRKGFRIDMSIKYRGAQKKVHLIIDESFLRTLQASE